MNPLPTLSSLPLELKARVVELAHLQDLRHRERWTNSERTGASLVAAARAEWHGKSLAALSETCEEFNALASVHLFRVRCSSLWHFEKLT